MLTAEITIYGKDGDTVWRQTKAVPNIFEALDYVAAIRSTVISVYLTKDGHVIDQQIREAERVTANSQDS